MPILPWVISRRNYEAEADRKIAGLQDQVDKLTGELQARRRKMHGKNNEKQTGDKSVNTARPRMRKRGNTLRMDVSNLPILMIQTKLPTQRRPIPKGFEPTPGPLQDYEG